MSGGIRTSVKGPLIARRVILAVEQDTVHDENETIDTDSTAADTVASASYGIGSCQSCIPDFPRVTSAAKVHKSNLMSYSFDQMRKATVDFHFDCLLGQGRTVRVYKGWIHEESFKVSKSGTGMAIAINKVKCNRRILPSSQKWLAEVNCCFQLAHPNLVKLIGYCLEGVDKRLLVYEFIPRSSLDKHLFSRDTGGPRCGLSWGLRIKIALGAAKGLAFLHSDKAKVVYGDFRASKILIDSNYNAKLHGYGVGKVGFEGYRSRVPFKDIFIDDCVVGTYKDHEYLLTGLVPKTDVYSFGLVLFEILSGEKDFYYRMSRGQEGRWLQSVGMNPSRGFSSNLASVEEVSGLIREKIKVLDASIEGQYSEDVALKALGLTIQCLSKEAVSRPNMDEVVQVLAQL